MAEPDRTNAANSMRPPTDEEIFLYAHRGAIDWPPSSVRDGDITMIAREVERLRLPADQTNAEVSDERLRELEPSFVRRSIAHTKHGHTSRLNGGKDTPTYRSWQAMLARCRYESRDDQAKYVNRGIVVDPAWLSFETFLADMGERPDGKTLDRRDNDQGYSKSNCQWATPIEQARNRRNTRLTFDTAVEVAVKRLLGAPYKELAAEYGCSESLPREIVKGRTWKDAGATARRIVEALNAA